MIATTLLRAFALVRRNRKAKLVILGEGSLRRHLMEEAEALGVSDNVSLPGFDANPLRRMREASVFVHCSRSEGYPNVPLEALAALPGGVRELLHNGIYGPLVPVGE